MPTAIQWIALSLALGWSAMVQAAGGFGFALMAMPLITLMMDSEAARPVIAVTGLLLFAGNAFRLRRHILWGEWLRLSLAGLAGIPLGFWLHDSVPDSVARAVLGVILVAYAGYSLLRPRALPTISRWWVYPAGVVAGALAAAYNLPGPPAAVYGDLRAWGRDEYRSILQSFFCLNGLIVVGGHAWLGNLDRQVGLLLLVSLPALFLGNLAGTLLDRHIDNRRFRQITLWLILAAGLALFF